MKIDIKNCSDKCLLKKELNEMKELISSLTKEIIDFKIIDRIVIVHDNGTKYSQYNIKSIELLIQDSSKTLKIFVGL